MTDQTAPPARHRCRHLFVDGRRCGSASLRHEQFCYYHHTTRRPAADPRARKALRSTLQLPIPEDRAAIQLSIGLILEHLASNGLDPRRAGLLLYGLQIASANLPPHPQLPAHAQPLPEASIEELVADPDHGLLAPPAEALKTRDQMWDDIRRERKILSDREEHLREREAAHQQEVTRFLLDRQSQITSESAPEQPPAPFPIPPSCFASPQLQAEYQDKLSARTGTRILKNLKATAIRERKPRPACTKGIFPSSRPPGRYAKDPCILPVLTGSSPATLPRKITRADFCAKPAHPQKSTREKPLAMGLQEASPGLTLLSLSSPRHRASRDRRAVFCSQR